MHYVSHRCRWMDTPLASRPLRWWERLADALRCAIRPRMPDRSRDRIDPYLPYGHWAAGWERPALPPDFFFKKAPAGGWHHLRAWGESFGNNSPLFYHQPDDHAIRK